MRVAKEMRQIFPDIGMVMNSPLPMTKVSGLQTANYLGETFPVPLATLVTSEVRAGPSLGAPSKDTKENILQDLYLY